MDSICPTAAAKLLAMNMDFDAAREDTEADDSFSREMRGYVDLGMHTEALRLVRKFLRRDPIEPEAFEAALDGLMVSGDRFRRWARHVESAYSRLSTTAKRDASWWMLRFYYWANDFGKAVTFIPTRPYVSIEVLDFAFAIDILVSLNRIDEARTWVHKAMSAGILCRNTWQGGVLESRIAEFHAAVGEWEDPITIYRRLRTHRAVAESSIEGIVQLRLAQALDEVSKGFAALREMRAKPDRELIVILPKNEASRWEKTEATLKRLEQRIKKMVPQEWQRDMR